ncbi:MAG TPA: lysine 2,3-aminomutase [bacterium]|nr:lysine 2,3-aminomutase [bacterium]
MTKQLFFREARRHPYWNAVSEMDWNDWHWQLRNRVTTPEQLQEILGLSDAETQEVRESLSKLRMAITPYYLSQIDADEQNCAIKLQAIPTRAELHVAAGEQEDPLHEDVDCPVPGLEGIMTHRYPDRLIIYTTYQCGMYCRHCTRRRYAGETDEPTPLDKIKQAVDYIRRTPQIRDVLVSGGDPFILSTERLDEILSLIRSVEHVEVIRIGTRTPVVLPMRITGELCETLRKYAPVWINTHFNHPKEMTDAAAAACIRLADAGMPLGNQTVLLRGVNNHAGVMKQLMHLLVANRIRPYYIYQCDLSQGIDHFRTRISEGVEIMENLRGHTSGYAIPQLVIDGVGGGGKVPYGPNYLLSSGTGRSVFRNYEGMVFSYAEPEGYESREPENAELYAVPASEPIGVAGLLADPASKTIIPQGLARLKRRKATESGIC